MSAFRLIRPSATYRSGDGVDGDARKGRRLHGGVGLGRFVEQVVLPGERGAAVDAAGLAGVGALASGHDAGADLDGCGVVLGALNCGHRHAGRRSSGSGPVVRGRGAWVAGSWTISIIGTQSGDVFAGGSAASIRRCPVLDGWLAVLGGRGPFEMLYQLEGGPVPGQADVDGGVGGVEHREAVSRALVEAFVGVVDRFLYVRGPR